jgi:hypothetical protein
VEQLPVQILVVVAIIQLRTLDNEVGKGSMSTAFEHGLAGPEGEGNSVHDLEGRSNTARRRMPRSQP